MLRDICLATSIAARGPRDRDTLTLPLAPRLVFVVRGLQRDTQQHVLDRSQYDVRDASAISDQIAQINNPRHREPRALCLDCRHELFCLRKG